MSVSEPQVLAVEAAESGVTLELFLPAELECFRGHFPGAPILPGVVQIDWVMGFAQRHLGLGQRVARDFQVKFRRVAVPRSRLRLALRLERRTGRLVFEYACGGELISSGHVALEPR